MLGKLYYYCAADTRRRDLVTVNWRSAAKHDGGERRQTETAVRKRHA